LDGGDEEMSEAHKQKLYCYVDETGQDTEGQLFLVSVVVTEQEQETFARELERIEAESGKRHIKWHKSSVARKIAYIKAVLACPIFQHTIFFAHYANSKAYVDLTVYTTAKAILQRANDDYKATVIVDGLSGSQVRHFSNELHKLHIHIRKVRGAKDEAEPGIRLADAFAGFLRDVQEGKEYAQELFQEAKAIGVVREV
jgi:Protein of unknown function (DUF3800)